MLGVSGCRFLYALSGSLEHRACSRRLSELLLIEQFVPCGSFADEVNHPLKSDVTRPANTHVLSDHILSVTEAQMILLRPRGRTLNCTIARAVLMTPRNRPVAAHAIIQSNAPLARSERIWLMIAVWSRAAIHHARGIELARSNSLGSAIDGIFVPAALALWPRSAIASGGIFDQTAILLSLHQVVCLWLRAFWVTQHGR